MSSPHSGYPHQHQGATYYQPSPPPTHVYGTHSPGPGHSPGPMSYNPYMHYPPPHMNHHHPHQQTPGRVNGGPRGGAGGSYPGNRNGHAHSHMYHQNYHHGHPPPPVPPPGPGPPPGPQSYGPHPGHHPHHPLLHAPHPQHPHSPHLAAKFGPLHPHTYSHTPPYPYPSPTSAGPYSPSWQPQQPQSPLPKQLSMPPPRGFSPAYYEPPQPQAPPAPPQPPPPQISPTRSSPLTQAMTMPGGDAPSVVIPAAAVHISKPVPSPISVVEFVPRQLQQQRAEAAAAAAAAIKAAEVEAEQRVEGAASDENLVSSQVEAPVDVEQASSSAEETHPVPEPTVNESTASTIIEAAAAITVDDSSLSALTTAPTAPPMSTNTITSTSPTALATTTYTMGTISHSSIPLSPAYSTISISSSSKPTHHHRKSSSHQSTASNIAIWSRRPGDPSKAPGIIISPRAKPPSDIVEKALDSRTPPLSPTIPSTSLPSEGIALKPSKILLEKGGVGEKQDDADVPAVQVALKHQHRVQVQQQSRQMINEEVATVESENVTEVTEVTEGVLTIPGSPASTSTSLSIAAAAGVKDAAVAPAPVGADATNSAAVVEDAQPSAGVSVTGAAPVESTSTASVDVAEPSSTTTTLTGSTTTTTTTTTPAPAPPKAGPPKSWASLFASSSSPSSSSAAGQRSALPTSSVVGISIPAPSAPVAPPIPVVSGKKTELLNLLTNGPGGAGAAQKPQQPEKIRTRGLINSGNMCFANAVLQVLVYCSPFQRLFIELGKLLGSHNAGASGSGVGGLNTAAASGGTSTVVNGVTVTQLNDPPHLTGVGNANGKQTKSQTPFIDATVEFLKEFIEDERDNNKRKKGGSGFSLQPTKKGKEREIFSANDFDDVEGGEDKDEWPESFLPSYVYDAMKEKKRFESMRGGQQEDAEEFLGFYLDTLEEELLHIQNSLAPPPPSVKPGPAKQAPVEEKEEPEPPEEDGWLEVGKKNRTIVTRTIKAVESPITRIFGGKFKSTLKAPGQKDSVLVEDWRSLRLDIQRDAIHTIQDALTYITHPQPIQMTHPARPGVTIDASQRVLIDALPPVLVLHVKRFCYDTTVGGVVKVMKQVRFEPELEIGSDMMAPTGKRPQPTRYRLFGAIYHHGHSASGGHYTLDILHPNRYPGAKIREGWVRIDDELVSDVRAEDVFDAWEKEKDEMRNAYLLFYRRIRSV